MARDIRVTAQVEAAEAVQRVKEQEQAARHGAELAAVKAEHEAQLAAMKAATAAEVRRRVPKMGLCTLAIFFKTMILGKSQLKAEGC